MSLFDNKNTLLLFDVDGTLTQPMKHIDEEMYIILNQLKTKGYNLAVVGGSNLEKIEKQLGSEMYIVFDYIFAENGVIAFKGSQEIHSNSIISYLSRYKKGEEENIYQEVVEILMNQLSKLRIPKKRGSFIELRRASINVSPIGRSCTYTEREEFYKYDSKHCIRKSLAYSLNQELQKYGLKASIGGMISLDILPFDWDKTYCLKHIEGLYENIIFYGDRTQPGENDHEIYSDLRTYGINVESAETTKKLLKDLI